ncbi:MAG: pyrroloquinoline quinone-dependent dehydrogenase [Tissierellales bacterium]
MASSWEYFGGDPGAQRYSSLKQITKQNVTHLKKAWTTRSGEQEEFSEIYNLAMFQNTPALIGDSILTCTAFNRIIALDPATGKEKWRYDPWESMPLFEAFFYRCRGLAYWQASQPDTGQEQPCQQRAFMALPTNHVVAIDTRTGKTCESFGDNGKAFVDRTAEMAFPGELIMSNPGTVIGDVVVFGSLIVDSYRATTPSGKIVALDVHSGEVRWEFDPLPNPSNVTSSPSATTVPTPGNWPEEGARQSGSANVWALMTADTERDLLFVPTSSPSPDFYGAFRHGDNRDANSLVALRGSTGEKLWSFQIVHHDLWDYDLSAPPVLVDLKHNGKVTPAVVQTTKQGLIFVFNRETGEPLFDIEERAVPQSTVPGEQTSPTQPFPVKPKPLLSHQISPTDAWGFTFWDRGKCRKRFEKLSNNGVYTPPSEQGTLQKPAWIGGMNWGGPAVDPTTGIMVVNLSNVVTEVTLEKRTNDMQPMQIISVDDTAIWRRHAGGDMLETPYRAKLDLVRSPFGAPCNAPPWGILASVDLNSGEILWKRPLGTIDRLAPLPLPLELGTPNVGGPLVTASGLVFIAATMDDRIRAIDIDSGKELWKDRLPASGQAGPMTYEWQGKQYVLIAAGGHAWMDTKRGDYYVAYTLEE